MDCKFSCANKFPPLVGEYAFQTRNMLVHTQPNQVDNPPKGFQHGIQTNIGNLRRSVNLT